MPEINHKNRDRRGGHQLSALSWDQGIWFNDRHDKKDYKKYGHRRRSAGIKRDLRDRVEEHLEQTRLDEIEILEQELEEELAWFDDIMAEIDREIDDYDDSALDLSDPWEDDYDPLDLQFDYWDEF